MERAPFQTVLTTPAFPPSPISSSTWNWSTSPKCRCRIRLCCRRIPVPALYPKLLLKHRRQSPLSPPQSRLNLPRQPRRLRPSPQLPRLFNPQRPRKRPRRLNRKRSPSSSVRIAQAAPAGNSGVAAINCCVYCSRGCAHNASVSPISTSRPRSITAIRVLR